MMLLISSLASIKRVARERASERSKKKADFGGGFRFDLRPAKERSDTAENQLRYREWSYSRRVRLIGDSFLIYLTQRVE